MQQFAIFFVFLIVGVFSQQFPDFFNKVAMHSAECIQESNAKPDVVQRLLQSGDFNGDKDVKCFLKCLYVKIGTMTPDGEMIEEAMRALFPPSADKAKVDMIVQKCKDLKGSDACETAFNVAKCSYDILKMP